MRIGAGSPQPAPGALFLFFRRSALLIHFRPSRPSSRDGFSNSFDERQLVMAGFYSMPQFKLNKASCTSADIFPPSPFPLSLFRVLDRDGKRRKPGKMAKLNALNAHLTASLLHFESSWGRGRGTEGAPSSSTSAILVESLI